MLQQGADARLRAAADGESALMKLARNAWRDAECVPVARLLLGAGADVLVAGSSGQTALHLACKSNKPGVALLLVEHGADINAVDKVDHNFIFLGVTYLIN